MKWVVAVYLWHIVYGFTLGAFYQPKDIPETAEACRIATGGPGPTDTAPGSTGRPDLVDSATHDGEIGAP